MSDKALDPRLENHLKACGLTEKRYWKLVKILGKYRDECSSENGMLTKFADKCYGKEDDRNLAECQARTFLEALFGNLEDIYSLGPEKAVDNNLSQIFSGPEGAKVEHVMKIRKNKSENFNVYDHGNAATDENHPMWTKELEHYLIGPTLGVGGTAKVKLAWDTKSKKEVAMKILEPKYAFQADKEIEVLKMLNHENIIRVYDHFNRVIWKDKKTTVFAIEYANEGELIEYLMYTAKFEEDLARWFFWELLTGVDYCHKNKIVHRDLKHDNCLLGDSFKLKITDFGFARKFYKKSGMNMKTAIGTAQYAAPEILAGESYDESVDVFSMGVMLFIALAGSQPWRRADKKTDKWYRMISSGDWDGFWDYHKRSHPFHKHENQKELLQGIFEPDPKKRWTLKDIAGCRWMSDTKVSQKEAAIRLKQRKKDMDKKKFEAQKKAPVEVKRKAIFDDNTAPMYYTQKPSHGHFFYSSERAPWVLDTLVDALTSNKAVIEQKHDIEKDIYKIKFKAKILSKKALEVKKKKKDDVTTVKGTIKVFTAPGLTAKVKDAEGKLVDGPVNLVIVSRKMCGGDPLVFGEWYYNILGSCANMVIKDTEELFGDDDQKDDN